MPTFVWSIHDCLDSLEIVIQIFKLIFHLSLVLILQRPLFLLCHLNTFEIHHFLLLYLVFVFTSLCFFTCAHEHLFWFVHHFSSQLLNQIRLRSPFLNIAIFLLFFFRLFINISQLCIFRCFVNPNFGRLLALTYIIFSFFTVVIVVITSVRTSVIFGIFFADF